MRYIIQVLVFILHTGIQAQTTFDVFTYKEPNGYKKEVKPGLISYTKTDNKAGTYCIISLYSQSLSSGNLTKDFDNDWASLVATPLSVTNAPEKDKGDEITGWKTISGGANFEFSGSTSMALLTTAKKEDANIAILVVTNSQNLLTTDVDAFYATLKLGTPLKAAVAQNNTPANNIVGSNTKPTSIVGEWLYDDALISILYYGNGYSDTYNNNVKMTIKNKLTIKADGTYEDYTFYNKGTFKKKEITARGKYKLSGNTITFTPNYYQYIKNDVVQPKDDARNLRPSAATYNFVYDEKAKAWGVQFTAADADSYFPEEVYLKADAYKKPAYVNQGIISVANNNSSGNIFLSDNGITGVWISYANINGGLGNISWNWRVFFSDRKSLSNLPNGGFANLKYKTYFDNSKNDAIFFNVGIYNFANGKGTNTKSGSNYTDKLELIKPNQLKIDGTVYMKCTSVNGQKLNGTFTTYANPQDPDLLSQPKDNRSVISFTTDGKFIDKGVYQTLLQDYGKDEAYNAAGKGTYELKDYSIILKFDDGRIKQEAFTMPLSYTTNNATIIFIGRAQLNKMK